MAITSVLALPKSSAKYVIVIIKYTNHNETQYVNDIINFIRGFLNQQIDLPDAPMFLSDIFTLAKGFGILNNIVNKFLF